MVVLPTPPLPSVNERRVFASGHWVFANLSLRFDTLGGGAARLARPPANTVSPKRCNRLVASKGLSRSGQRRRGTSGNFVFRKCTAFFSGSTRPRQRVQFAA